MKMFIGKYNKSVILTFVGVALSVTGMVLAQNRTMDYAMLCLIVAGICDLFDGKVARMCKRTAEEESFGVEIDSLADVINFVAFPIVVFYGLGLTSWYHTALYVLFALAAVERLGFFNITVAGMKKEESFTHYRGLPVTYGALIFPLVWLLSYSSMPTNVFNILYTVVIALVALFFVLDIKITKPKGVAYIFFFVLALLVIAFILIMGAM